MADEHETKSTLPFKLPSIPTILAIVGILVAGVKSLWSLEESVSKNEEKINKIERTIEEKISTAIREGAEQRAANMQRIIILEQGVPRLVDRIGRIERDVDSVISLMNVIPPRRLPKGPTTGPYEADN